MPTWPWKLAAWLGLITAAVRQQQQAGRQVRGRASESCMAAGINCSSGAQHRHSKEASETLQPGASARWGSAKTASRPAARDSCAASSPAGAPRRATAGPAPPTYRRRERPADLQGRGHARGGPR